MSGIKVNQSDKKVVTGGNRWTGVGNSVVKLINPTKAEMEAVGMQPKSEPNYFKENEGKAATFRLAIFVTEPNVKANNNVTFFLEPTIRLNKEGTKTQWVNKFGQFTWNTDNSITELKGAPQWFKMDGARPAITGEEDVTNFIKNWANVDQESQAVLDDPMALAKGNLAELKSLFAQIPNNQIGLLWGMKRAADGKIYPTIYNKFFSRPYIKAYDKWKQSLENPYATFDADYQGDLHFKPYEGNATVEQDTPDNMDTNNAPTSGAGVPPFKF